MLKTLFGDAKGKKENEEVSGSQFLREQVVQIRQQLQLAEDTFNLLDDEALLDALIYRIKALNLYYDHLLKLTRLEEQAGSEAEVREERISEVMG